jgi:hypothetical protein
MKKLIGILVFGIICGVSSVFCYGAMEAGRLAEGVNFDNPSEVSAYAQLLRNNDAVKNQAKDEGVSLEVWIQNTVTAMTESYHSNQEAIAKKEARERRFSEADRAAARNIESGVVLLDVNTQQQILRDLENNRMRGNENLRNYLEKQIQYTGEVRSIVEEAGGIRPSYEDRDYSPYFNSLSIGKGIRLIIERDNISTFYVFLLPSERSKVLNLNKGDIITVIGKSTYIWAPSRLYMRLEEGHIK